MKTNISRYRNEASRRYDAVYQQQGRVLTDADWNALVDTLRLAIRNNAGAAIDSGAPAKGGLLAFAPGDRTPRLAWGEVFVDGHRGAWERDPGAAPGDPLLASQVDLPGLPEPGGDHTLYVDLWQRPVTALEDAALIEPALDGADTCTRLRTMVQVKWASLAGGRDGVDDDRLNPRRGDAEFAMDERADAVAADDPCDPRAEEIRAEGLGDRLFRLEVHAPPAMDASGDHVGELVLKWSSENGAEAQARDAAVPGFDRPDYAYELFSVTTESHLGVHLTPDDLAGYPARGHLAAGGLPDETERPELPWARRWDGHCRLSRDAADGSWTFLEGWHRGTPMTTAPVGSPEEDAGSAEARTADTALILFLDRFRVELSLATHRFVAGDYWLATVREADSELGRVQVESATPLGVEHHYLRLFSVTGGSVEALSEAEWRRFRFQALSELDADRVGYDPSLREARWRDILDDPSRPLPRNVQAALDELLAGLESSDIFYRLQACEGFPEPARPLVERLAELAGWSLGERVKLADLLTVMLCRSDAHSLPYAADGEQSLHDVILDRTRGGTVAGDVGVEGELRAEAVTARERFRYPPDAEEGLVLTAVDDDGNAQWLAPPGGVWRETADGHIVTRSGFDGAVGIATDAPRYGLDVSRSFGQAFRAGLGETDGRVFTTLDDNHPALALYHLNRPVSLRFRQSPGSDDPDNPGNETSPMFDAAITGFRGRIGIHRREPREALDIGGSVRLSPEETDPTLVYHGTNVAGRPRGTGVRWRYEADSAFSGRDAVIFEKTDDSEEPPAGATVFVNRGEGDVPREALTIHGDGRVVVGQRREGEPPPSDLAVNGDPFSPRGGWVTGVRWVRIRRQAVDGGEDDALPLFEDEFEKRWAIDGRRVPRDAREILLHIQARLEVDTTDGEVEYRIWTQDDGGPYEKYLYIANGEGVSSGSDNLWLPVTREGAVHVRVINFPGFRSGFTGRLFLLGYR